MRKGWAFVAVVVAIIANGAPARAQDKAAAEAAFQEGRRLLHEGKVSEACPKFEASFNLDPATGTLLNLADCLEKDAKTASAWARFTEAAERSRREGQQKRQQEAERRANLLKPRLSTLTIKAPAEGALAVTRDGQNVTALLGVAMPVDPGKHVVGATRAGTSGSQDVNVEGEGKAVTVEVPPFWVQKAPPPKPPEVVPPPKPVEPPPTPETPEEQAARKIRTRHIIAASVGGAGVALVGVGLVFGAGAKGAWDDSRANCNSAGVCNATGVQQVDDANSKATLATVFVGVGLAAVAGGVVLWVTAPKKHRAAADDETAWRIVPTGNGLAIAGGF